MARSYEIALFILQKVSCSLSVAGSLMIISQVTRSSFNRSKPQQRLVLGLSISDVSTSLVWIFTPLFMPSESGAVWAIGNQTTCNIQGFIVTLFNASAILYMCALQLQYLLTIKYGWTESRIRTVEPYMHGVPWCLGLAAAITQLSLKLFNPADWDCWIAPFPSDCTSSHQVKKGGTDLTETDCIRGDNAEIYRWSFFFAPLWVAITFCIIVLVLIYKTVWESERRSLRHSIQRSEQLSNSARQRETRKKSMLVRSQKVKTQCFMYAGAFFIVWTFPTIARLIQLLGGAIHPIIGVLAGTFIGSQGFFNAIIFFRPRYSMIEKPGVLAKVWALICSTLFFCCHGKNYIRGTKYDTDYMPPPNNYVRSSGSPAMVAGMSVSAEGIKAADEEFAAKVVDDIDKAELGREASLSGIEHKRVYFQSEPATVMNEMTEDDPGTIQVEM